MSDIRLPSSKVPYTLTTSPKPDNQSAVTYDDNGAIDKGSVTYDNNGAIDQGSVTYDNNGLAEHANLQQTAWNLGYDKQLSPRIEQSLLQEAVATSQDHVGATVKDFVDGAVDGLVANGVGEEDAKMLLDAFVTKDLGSGKQLDTGLKQVMVGRTDTQSASEMTEAERFKSPNPEAVTISDLTDSLKQGNMQQFLSGAQDMMSVYAAHAPEGSTVSNFLSELANQLSTSGDLSDVSRPMQAIQTGFLKDANFGDKISDWAAKL